MKRTKILIAGMGGVGGYFGGRLAYHFANHPEVEVYFLARGQHLNEIQNSGLTIVEGDETWIAVPKMASDDSIEIGEMDYILVCTKSYDLEEVMEKLRPCITETTVILPLLNGVDCSMRIRKLFPNNLVCDGCVYIIGRLASPGRVENQGNIQKLFFGVQGLTNPKLVLLEKLFLDAGLEAKLSETIESIIWEKFIFISAMAGSTTYFDEPVGPIVADAKKRDIVKSLVLESTAVAYEKGISVPKDMPKKVLDKLDSLPPGATSSLHSDIQNNKAHNEFDSLVNHVALEGRKLGLATPVYNRLTKARESQGN